MALGFALRPSRFHGLPRWLALALATAALDAQPSLAATPAGAPTAAPSAAAADWLQLLDGSSLHGQLASVDARNDVRWQCPAARNTITFGPTNIAVIGFEHAAAPPPVSPATCRVRFRNGDEVLGTITSLEGDTLGLETWFAGPLHAARRYVQSITFLPRGFAVRYEGPAGFNGWKFGRDPQAWQYRDGAFIASATASLARDFHIQGSSSLEFDLAWTGSFEMILILYTDVLDRLDYNASSYLVFLGSGFVNVQRVQTGFGVLQLGQTALPELLKQNHAHFELRALKDQATLELRVDGGPVYRWKDARGLLTQGPGIVFFPQLDNVSGRLSLSNLRVCSWDGPAETELATNLPPAGDWIHLVNHDQLTGTLRAVHEGKLTVATAQTQLDIPLSRVTQIILGNANTHPPPLQPREARAYFAGGDTLSFELEKWDAHQVSGQSEVFGRVALRTESIRRLQFNLDRSVADYTPLGESTKADDTWDE